MTWASDLKRLTEKGKHDLGELAMGIKIELFSGVVADTRVDTGLLRGNWQIQENTPATGSLEVEDKTPQGGVPAHQEQEIIAGATPEGLTWFTNNLPYAAVWEERDAMVGRNVARVRQNVKKMAEEIR